MNGRAREPEENESESGGSIQKGIQVALENYSR